MEELDEQSTLLLNKLQENIHQVKNDSQHPLDHRLFDESILFLVPRIIQNEPVVTSLISQLSSFLAGLEQDPSPVLSLLEKLVEPLMFADVLSLQPPVNFEGGLDSAALPYNRLMLRLIEKASKAPTDIAAFANLPSTVRSFVALWLTTPDAGVAEDCAAVLLKLLTADCSTANGDTASVSLQGVGGASASAQGQGLLWRRIFSDRDIYSLFFSICSTHPRRERSLAQARLMSIAPALGSLDWSYLARSHHPDIEREFGLDPPREGLLDFLAVNMVDYRGDVLLHMNLLQFFEDLIAKVKCPSSQNRNLSVSLEFLKTKGLHQRSISYWLLPNDPSHDPMDLSFLYGPSAQYMASYALNCPDAFLNDAEQPVVLQRLSKAFSISANQWAQGQSPKHDLNVLVSLPRISLLPQSHLGTGRLSSPAFLIPCRSTNADALNSIARILHGPQSNEDTAKTSAVSTPLTHESGSSHYPFPSTDNEAAAARALYALYCMHHDNFISALVEHADIVALPEKALAALNVICSVASAVWAPLPVDNSFSKTNPPTSTSQLPSESKLASLVSSTRPRAQVAPSGIEALLQSPARESVFPFLLRPPQTFTHLVGGRGDPESNVYKIAMAKWDCLLLVQRKLAEAVERGRGGPQAGMLLSAIQDRAQEGPWGSQSHAGGQVASLEL